MADQASMIERSQMATAAAIDEMHRIKRQPVPYTNDAVMPQLQKPYPTDSHLVNSRHCVTRHGDMLLPTSETADFARNSDSSVRWANFSIPSPNIFDAKPAAAAEPPAEPEAAPALSEREVGLLLTKHMEWNLQRNAYNPEIAAQMRINVRKSAQIKAQIVEESEVKTDANFSSQCVKQALFGERMKDPVPANFSATLSTCFPTKEACQA